MLPHCAVHMLRTISLHFFRAPLNGCRSWDGPIVFQRLARLTTSKPPTSILWYAAFDIPTFWCDTRSEEVWVTWPNISLSHKGDPRFVRNWKSNNPTSPVQCSFVKIWLSSWLGYEWKFAMAVATLRNPSCEARFSWKSIGNREQLAASHVNSQSFLNARRGAPAWSTASHINLQSPWTQDALSLKKHMESRRVSATHLAIGKRYGIRERLAACHMNLQAHWRRDAFYLKNTRNLRGVGTTRIFIEKHHELAGGGGHRWHLNLQSKWSLSRI